LEHFPHLDVGARFLLAGRQPSAPREWREGMVRLANRPENRGIDRRLVQDAGLAAQKKLAADIQVEAYTNDVPYVPTGQFVVPTAYRKNLDGIIVAPVVFLWNVEKK